MQKIYSIIVIYNGMRQNWIQKCFDSVLSSNVETEIIAIDNDSSDNSVEFIQKNYPQVKLVVANENLGFAKANNIGIKYALEQKADYVFLLNQDAWIEKNTIEQMITAFEQTQDAGIVSPIHLNGNKTNLDVNFTHFVSRNNVPDFISDLYFDKLQTCYKTNFVNAACWLISRKCIEKVGGFDTSIFCHYGEDDNYCQRVIYHGFKIYIATATTMCHDREKRLDGTEEYRSAFWNDKNAMLNWKIKLGNINNEFNLNFKLKQIKREILKNLILFRFRRIMSLKDEITLMNNIQKSREINIKGGLVWL